MCNFNFSNRWYFGSSLRFYDKVYYHLITEKAQVLVKSSDFIYFEFSLYKSFRDCNIIRILTSYFTKLMCEKVKIFVWCSFLNSLDNREVKLFED